MTVIVDAPVYPHGFVAGRYLTAVADGPDVDRLMDFTPAKGKVIFTPETVIRRHEGPVPALVVQRPVTCELDEQGYLTSPGGGRGVALIAGIYAVRFDVQGAQVPGPTRIEVKASHTEAAPLDLVLAMPEVVPPGSVVVVDETTAQRAEAAAARAEAVVADIEPAVQAAALSSAEAAAAADRAESAADSMETAVSELVSQSPADSAVAAVIGQEGTQARAAVAAVTPLLSGPLVEPVVTDRGGDPIPCGVWGGYMWGTSTANPATLYRRASPAVAWETVAASVPVLGVQGVQRLMPTADGEVLAFGTGSVERSTGWGTSAVTWARVLTNPTASYMYPWAIDGDGTRFIVVHYSGSGTSTPDRADSRYGWISTDGGRTWAVKWDTAARWSDDLNSRSHIHGACWDPWGKRFLISEGHEEATGVYESYDDGDTWARIPYAAEDFPTGQPGNSATTLCATEHGIVMGSDSAQNGIYVIPRGERRIRYRWVWDGIQNTTLLGYAHQSTRDPDTGLVYTVFVAYGTAHAPIVVSDGRSAQLVWTDPLPGGMWRRISIHNGAILAWDQTGNRLLSARTGPLGTILPTDDQGRVLGGAVEARRGSVAVGREAVAKGSESTAVNGTVNGTWGVAVGAQSAVTASGVAIGRGARADGSGVAIGLNVSGGSGVVIGASAISLTATSMAVGREARAATDADAGVVNSTAVGRSARANAPSGSATALGHTATATGALSTALGQASSVTGAFSTAVGQAATSPASYGTALGRGATVSHARSVALGDSTATAGTDGVFTGPRYWEIEPPTSEPVAPVAGRARMWTRQNAAGKTELCVRFNTGGIVVIATQP